MPPVHSTPTNPIVSPKEPAGPIIGIAIIVLLLIVGGFYFWGAKINKQKPHNDLPYMPGGAPTTS